MKYSSASVQLVSKVERAGRQQNQKTGTFLISEYMVRCCDVRAWKQGNLVVVRKWDEQLMKVLEGK